MNDHYYSTGGGYAHSMTLCYLERNDGLYENRTRLGEVEQMILTLDISGPIDAPTLMPAGSMNSILRRDEARETLPPISLCRREQ